jgi:hypothetical protein
LVEKYIVPEVHRSYHHPGGYRNNFTHLVVFPVRERSEEERMAYLHPNYPILTDGLSLPEHGFSQNNLTNTYAGEYLDMHEKTLYEQSLWGNFSWDFEVNLTRWQRWRIVDAFYAKQLGFALPIEDVTSLTTLNTGINEVGVPLSVNSQLDMLDKDKCSTCGPVKDLVFQDLDLDLGEIGGVLKFEVPDTTMQQPAGNIPLGYSEIRAPSVASGNQYLKVTHLGIYMSKYRDGCATHPDELCELKLMKVIQGKEYWEFQNDIQLNVHVRTEWIDPQAKNSESPDGEFILERTPTDTTYYRLEHLGDRWGDNAPLGTDKLERGADSYKKRMLQVDIPMNTNFLKRRAREPSPTGQPAEYAHLPTYYAEDSASNSSEVIYDYWVVYALVGEGDDPRRPNPTGWDQLGVLGPSPTTNM